MCLAFLKYEHLFNSFGRRKDDKLPEPDRFGIQADRSARSRRFQDAHCQNWIDSVILRIDPLIQEKAEKLTARTKSIRPLCGPILPGFFCYAFITKLPSLLRFFFVDIIRKR